MSSAVGVETRENAAGAAAAPGTAVAAPPSVGSRLGKAAALTLVIGLSLWLAFGRGGFFVGETAIAAVIACTGLLLWAMAAFDPLAGLTRAGGVAVAGLAGLSVWSLVSSSWSQAAARAVYDHDRLLLYLAVVALMAATPGATGNVRQLVRGLAAVLVVVCAAGLLARLYPQAVASPVSAQEDARLSWPLGYWNAMGLAATMAMVLCVHLASDLREHVAVRVVAAAAVPGLAATLFLTLSRGSFVVGAVGLALLVALGRSRGTAGALLAVVPTAAVSLLAAGHADALTDRYDVTSAATLAAGRALGRDVLLLVAAAALLRLVAVALDRRLARLRLPAWSRRWRVAATAAVLVALAGTALVADAPTRLAAQWDAFRAPTPAVSTGSGRLLQASANGRIEHWTVAWDVWRAHPLRGTGAGTYVYEWARHRTRTFTVQDAHSLYLQTLSELGLVGLVLLALALLVPVASALRRRREDRVLWSAIVAVAVMWLIHAGIDWDWQLPAVTLPVLALLAAACARDRPRSPGPLVERRVPRLLVGLGILLLMLTPVKAAASQRALDQALTAFQQRDCERAIDRALAAQSALGMRPEPFEVLGYCDARLGRADLGEQMLLAAVRRDPRSWELRYGLALVRGVAGQDPRPALRAALRRNPREPVVRDALQRMATDTPSVWRRQAARLPLAVPDPAPRRPSTGL